MFTLKSNSGECNDESSLEQHSAQKAIDPRPIFQRALIDPDASSVQRAPCWSSALFKEQKALDGLALKGKREAIARSSFLSKIQKTSNGKEEGE